MDLGVGIILFLLFVIIIVASIVSPLREWLKGQDSLFSIYFALIGTVVAIWFGFSADQLSKEANDLGVISKEISKNSFFYYTIDSDKNKPDDYPEIQLKSGAFRILFTLYHNPYLENDMDTIQYGIINENENSEIGKVKLKTVSPNTEELTEKNVFKTNSFYYYFIIGAGLNRESNVRTMVFMNDNLSNNETLLKNSEYFTDFGDFELISKEGSALRHAQNYLEKKDEKLVVQRVKEISKEITGILNHHEEIKKKAKEILE